MAGSSSTSPQHPLPNQNPHEHASSSSSNLELKQVVVEQNPNPTLSKGHDEIDDACATGESSMAKTAVDLDGKGMDERLKKDESRKYEIKFLLHRAAQSGNWGEMEPMIKEHPDLMKESITEDNETALHIAAGAKNVAVVANLVKTMDPKDMSKQNKYGKTALFFAAASGALKIAKMMVEKNQDLPNIHVPCLATPLFIAIVYKNRHMTSYLLSVTKLDSLQEQHQLKLLTTAIHSDFYDVSLEILKKNPKLALERDPKNNNETALHVLATKASAFSTGTNKLDMWNKCIKVLFCKKDLKDVKNTALSELFELLWKDVVKLTKKERSVFINHPTNLMQDAARARNVEFLIMFVRKYPNMMMEHDTDGKTIFHIAIENRLEVLFNFIIHETRGLKQFNSIYKLNNMGRKHNMLHLAAKLPASNHLNRVSGAVFQMQRELLWFKEVEKITLPYQLEAKSEGLTPRESFTKEHKSLVKDGEKWIRNTANYCMLVSTLITTIVFAAAFTVPGGTDDDMGSPILQGNFCFTLFVISDAVAFISSSISILIFLSIQTSRYAEEDFFHSLPFRLLLGFTSLFVSILCMIVAFCATFFMLYRNTHIPVPTLVAILAIVPIICFFSLQVKLCFLIFKNTYCSRFLFKLAPQGLFSTGHFLKVLHDLRKLDLGDEEERASCD